MKFRSIAAGCGLAVCAILLGCEGRPTLFPNSDPALRRTSTEFASDAAKRFPYPGTTARAGDAQGRVEIDVMMRQLQILNSSGEDWKNIDVWVNEGYVCHVPLIPKGKEKVETIAFAMLYDPNGDYFSTNGGKTPVNRVEIYRDGKLLTVPMRMAD